MFKCDRCDKEFVRKDNLSRHLNVHNGTSFECVRCSVKFTRADALKRHLKNAHNMDNEKFFHKCNKCEIQFTRIDNLKRHEKHQHIPEKVVCANKNISVRSERSAEKNINTQIQVRYDY